MERLTHRCDLGFAEAEQISYTNPADPEGLYNIMDWARELALNNTVHSLVVLSEISERLADYEDTGLTPE